MLKNAATNYGLNLNVDRIMGRDTTKYGSSLFQQVIDNINNKSATRIKLYPYKDIFSFTMYQSLVLANRIDLSYQIQGKFKVQSLLSWQLDKVNHKNLHSFKLIVPNFLNVFKYESQLNIKQSDLNSVQIENTIYMNPATRLYFGIYSKHKAGFQANRLMSLETKHVQLSMTSQIMRQMPSAE
jgi:hypothetical protein